MRRPWIRQGAIETGRAPIRAMQLEAAKEILAEVFHTRPARWRRYVLRR